MAPGFASLDMVDLEQVVGPRVHERCTTQSCVDQFRGDQERWLRETKRWPPRDGSCFLFCPFFHRRTCKNGDVQRRRLCPVGEDVVGRQGRIAVLSGTSLARALPVTQMGICCEPAKLWMHVVQWHQATNQPEPNWRTKAVGIISQEEGQTTTSWRQCLRSHLNWV